MWDRTIQLRYTRFTRLCARQPSAGASRSSNFSAGKTRPVGGTPRARPGGSGMFIPTKKLMTIFVALAVLLTPHTARNQTGPSKGQTDLRYQHRLADLGIDAGSVAQFPAGTCSQQRPEPPAKCNCTDVQGHISPRQAECFSCWDPASGQKCGGPYCQSCADVCTAGGSVPTRSPSSCH